MRRRKDARRETHNHVQDFFESISSILIFSYSWNPIGDPTEMTEHFVRQEDFFIYFIFIFLFFFMDL